jgi:hypothetical protein
MEAEIGMNDDFTRIWKMDSLLDPRDNGLCQYLDFRILRIVRENLF